MNEDFTKRVKKVRLTLKEEMIVEKVMQNLSKTAFLSGVELAEECGVSATLITRFAQKLGYNKFSEFKDDLEELYRQTTTPYEMFKCFTSDRKKNDIFNDSIAQDLQNLINMQKLLDKSVLEQVVLAIEQGKNIYLAAMFASEVGIHLFSHYFQRLDKPHTAITGIGLSKQLEYSDISSEDVLITISSQRILQEVRDAAIYAKNCGAKTIAITDSATNHLARVCDYVLIAPVTGTTFDYSHVATLAMVNVIVNSLAARNPEYVFEKLEKVKKRWNEKHLFCT